MQVTIDPKSGFCFGVIYAIQMAEEELEETGTLYCLGDIVHNDLEVKRLQEKGLQTIHHDDLKDLRDCTVLIRAHGEPPSTYETALNNNIKLLDASCPVVLKLQNRVRESFDVSESEEGQIVVMGKEGHAEVIGIQGQTLGKAIIVMDEEDLDQLDYSKPIHFFSQTTKSTEKFYRFKEIIEQRAQSKFEANDTICRQVSNRGPQMEKFSQEHDVILFIAGKKSSNGRVLHDICKSFNPNTYFLSDLTEFDPNWVNTANTVGISGATSTPQWQMEALKELVLEHNA